jgi:heat shock protein HslJ
MEMHMTVRLRRLVTASVAALAIAALVAACSSSSASPSAAGASLTSNTWNLSAITEKVPAFQGVVPADQQANYTITFQDGGNAQIKADCNSVGATYTTTGSNGLAITLGPSTLVACPEGSMADQYLAGLAAAASYAISGSDLTITLKDEGTLQFVAAK